MFSYVRSFFNYFFPNGSEDEDDDYRESLLAENLVEFQIHEENLKRNEEKADPILAIPRDAECFKKSGRITYKDDQHAFIDDIIYFDLSSCAVQLNLKDRVLYLGYKDVNDTTVVVRILENQGQFWGNEESAEEGKFSVIEHVIIGEVDKRDGRMVHIKDSDLKFNLDEVESNLVPIKGDWLQMKCSIQYDDDRPSDISAQQVLKVLSFKPLRCKVKSSVVTSWMGSSGTCDSDIYINKQCIQNAFDPHVGDKVLLEAIESNQGAYPWRAIKLIVTHKSPKDIAPIIETDLEKESLKVEQELRVEVTYPIAFDKIDIRKTADITVTITNHGDHVQYLQKWIILSRKRDSQITVSPTLHKVHYLYPNRSFNLTISCRPKFLGNSKEHLIVMFKGFKVERFIHMNIVSNNISIKEPNNENIFYNGDKIESMRKVLQSRNTMRVPGVRIDKPPNFIPVRLGMFSIPENVWAAVLGNSNQTVYSSDFEKILDRLVNYLPILAQDLNFRNYVDRWHTLLYMEEIQANIGIRCYDMAKVFLLRFQEYLGIEVEGLAEKRPSVVIGDKVVVKDVWDERSPQYEGYIHDIKGNVLLLKFHPHFHESYAGSDVSVEFQLSRSTYRKCHQGINLAHSNLGAEILFPCRIALRPPKLAPDTFDLTPIDWYNKKLNREQKAAVTNILLGECRPLPYCIYGPPGTGKTMTVVETILQILTVFPDSRVLVAAPSNSASNLITERLVEYRERFSDSIVRIIARYLVDSQNIPDVIKPYCATIDISTENTRKSKYAVHTNGINMNCQSSFIGRHRVTIGTCCCMGQLAQIGLPRGHFTHVVVDEAGQATEPELMVALTFLDKESGQIVLAGDPMQLGPVVMSRYAAEFGLNESYLCRVLETYPYQKDFESYPNGFNSKFVTRLNDNYRSLKEVLTLPSEMFYDGTLVPKVTRSIGWISNTLDVLCEMFGEDQSKAGGIYVYGIRGCNARSEDSPSWYNLDEASMVALTTSKLIKNKIPETDIGIITPYIAQVKFLRVLFEGMGIPIPKIGTVEEFQGQEKPIIIMTTVRSSENHLPEDMKCSLGFIRQPKRLNVALTRAQVAVLLFCDPHLLSTDRLWAKVINQAVKEDKYTGCDLPFTISNQIVSQEQ